MNTYIYAPENIPQVRNTNTCSKYREYTLRSTHYFVTKICVKNGNRIHERKQATMIAESQLYNKARLTVYTSRQ